MTDIVEQLRGWATDWNGAPMVRGEPPRDGLHCEVLIDAADEIERLRTALRRISSLAEKNVPKYAQQIARAALEQSEGGG